MVDDTTMNETAKTDDAVEDILDGETTRGGGGGRNGVVKSV